MAIRHQGWDTSKKNSLYFSVLPFICKKIPFIKPFICFFKPIVRPYENNNGFTLIELIITLTIAGVMLALAGPAMRTFILSQRLTTQANDFIADINFARSEAIKRSGNIGVCASSSGSDCSGTWGNGWVVFRDADNSRTWTSGDALLRVHESITGGIAVNSSATIVVFNNAGLLDNGAGAGDYTFCSSQLGQSRKIGITTTGRPALSSGTC